MIGLPFIEPMNGPYGDESRKDNINSDAQTFIDQFTIEQFDTIDKDVPIHHKRLYVAVIFPPF